MNSKYQHVIDVMRDNPRQSVILSQNFSEEFDSYTTVLERRLIEYYQYEEQMKQYKKVC